MSRRLFPDPGGRPLLYLHAGDLIVQTLPALVSTVLGSCVSVTMHCARLKAGGICHAQFPTCNPKRPHKNDLIYADLAVARLHELFAGMGALRGEVEVKVFGGGEVLKHTSYADGRSIGRSNSGAALGKLEELGLTPVATLLHQDRGLRLFFFTDTGEVLLRKTQIT